MDPPSALGANNFTTGSVSLVRADTNSGGQEAVVRGRFKDEDVVFRFNKNLAGDHKLIITDRRGTARTFTFESWTENELGQSLNGRLFQEAESGNNYVIYYDDNPDTAQNGWQIVQVDAGEVNPATGRRQVSPIIPNKKTNPEQTKDQLPELTPDRLDELLRARIFTPAGEDREGTAFFDALETGFRQIQSDRTAGNEGSGKERLETVFSESYAEMLDAIFADKKTAKQATCKIIELLGQFPQVRLADCAPLLDRIPPTIRNSVQFVKEAVLTRADSALVLRLPEKTPPQEWNGIFYLDAGQRAELLADADALAALDNTNIVFILDNLKQAKIRNVMAGMNEAGRNKILSALTDPEAQPLSAEQYLFWRCVFREQPAEAFAAARLNKDAYTKEQLDSLIDRCRALNIEYPERFDSVQILEQILQMREPPLDPRQRADQPVALLIYNKADHNGAFQDNNMLELLARGFRVCYYEMDADTDIPQAFRDTYYCNAAEPGDQSVDPLRPQRPIDLVIWGGHGAPDSIQLGNYDYNDEADRDRAHLDRTDDFLADSNRYVDPDCVFISEPCFNGYKQDVNNDGVIDILDDVPGNQNMIDFFRQLFPGAGHRYYGAPDIAFGAPILRWDGPYKIAQVIFKYNSLDAFERHGGLSGAYARDGVGSISGALPVTQTSRFNIPNFLQRTEVE